MSFNDVLQCGWWALFGYFVCLWLPVSLWVEDLFDGRRKLSDRDSRGVMAVIATACLLAVTLSIGCCATAEKPERTHENKDLEPWNADDYHNMTYGTEDRNR
jgi:hypothetical protein